MAIIDSDHSLTAQDVVADTPVQAGGYGDVRSSYCYLFDKLANAEGADPDLGAAGLFTGSSPDETLMRLRAFEAVYRGLQFPIKPLRMKLAPVYTYFGQFVNHDISAPVGGLASEAASITPAVLIPGAAGDPPGLDKLVRAESISPILDRVRNEHGAPLTLDSLYADGPQSSDPQVKAMYRADGMRFVLARTVRLDDTKIKEAFKGPGTVVHPVGGASDLPRENDEALIADRRNDENLIISQLHLAMMLLHNKAVDALHPQNNNPAACFKAARTLVTHHYQWCVLHDYLKNLLSPGVLDNVLRQPPRLQAPNQVPMEFTAAAFRFGHSMVSAHYDYNANFGKGGSLRDHAKLQELFDFTSRRRMMPFPEARQLPDHWVADWNRLTRPMADDQNGADRIDLLFAHDMLNQITHGQNLHHASIFFRNVLRGFHRRIPFGQVLAKAYDIDPLTPPEVLAAFPEGLSGDDAAKWFDTQTPAWLYFLCEAQAKEGGERLGPTASHIIADTIVGLLKLNKNSVLNTAGGAWHPQNSVLKTAAGLPLDSLRAMMMFAVE